MKFTNMDRCREMIKKINKMPCGRKIEIGVFGTITSYRDKRTGKRRFSLTETGYLPPSGNLSIAAIREDITQFYTWWE